MKLTIEKLLAKGNQLKISIDMRSKELENQRNEYNNISKELDKHGYIYDSRIEAFRKKQLVDVLDICLVQYSYDKRWLKRNIEGLLEIDKETMNNINNIVESQPDKKCMDSKEALEIFNKLLNQDGDLEPYELKVIKARKADNGNIVIYVETSEDEGITSASIQITKVDKSEVSDLIEGRFIPQ